MQFQKGHRKTGGRAAGTPNKTTTELREQLQQVVQTILAELPETLSTMEPADRIRVLTILMPYVMPKLTSIDITPAPVKPEQNLPSWLSAAKPTTTTSN